MSLYPQPDGSRRCEHLYLWTNSDGKVSPISAQGASPTPPAVRLISGVIFSFQLTFRQQPPATNSSCTSFTSSTIYTGGPVSHSSLPQPHLSHFLRPIRSNIRFYDSYGYKHPDRHLKRSNIYLLGCCSESWSSPFRYFSDAVGNRVGRTHDLRAQYYDNI